VTEPATTSPARIGWRAGPPGKLKWYAAAFVGTGIMATLGVFVRNVSPGNEYAITFGRFAVGLACLLGWGALRRGPRPAARPRVTWGLAASGVVLPLFVVFYIKAVVSGAMANAAFLLYLGPLIASFLAALWLGEGINRLSAALLGGALLGTLFITEFRLPQARAEAEGLAFGLLSGLFYGLFLLFNNRRVQGEGSSYARSAAQFLIAALVMAPILAWSGINLTRSDLLWVLGIGVLHGFVALTLVMAALGHLRTVEYGTISYGEPVIAALIGGIAYQEPMSALQIAGCLLVLGTGIARVSARERPVEDAP